LRLRLTTLDEYIDDTEDYINIVQDKHRNQLLQVIPSSLHAVATELLLQLELIITAGTFALTIMAVVSGIFGMNLENKVAENKSSTPFLTVCRTVPVLHSASLNAYRSLGCRRLLH